MFPDQQNSQNYAQMPVPSRRSHSYFMLFAISTTLLLAVIGLAVWLFMDSNSLKSDFDGEVQKAVAERETVIQAEIQAQFDEEAKSPNKTAKLAEALGGFEFSYPKTWSIYAVEKSTGTKLLDVYAHPDIVPDTSGETAFAFRATITNSAYDSAIKDLQKRVDRDVTSSTPYRSNGVLGSKFEGEIDSKTSGVLIALPLRDKTIKIWTESSTYITDFLKLAESLKFQP